MKNIYFTILIFFLTKALSAQLVDTIIFTNWLNENSFELSSQKSKGYEQILSVLENKTIVGLGECVHGSSTINNMRINLSKALIQNGSFNTIAFEMSLNTGLRVNYYLATGKGDIKKIISESHYFCNSKELLDFLQWIRKQNETGTFQISCYGFDIQSNIDIVTDIKSYFEKVDNSSFECSNLLYHIFKVNGMGNFGDYNHELQDSVLLLTSKLRDKLKQNKKEYVLKEGYIDTEYALLRCEVLIQYLQMLNSGYSQSLMLRDSCNAELVNWIKYFEGENSKLILFAHNGHLGKSQRFIPRVRTLSVDGFYEDYPEELSTGFWLKQKFDDKYFFIGTQFNKGSFIGYDPENNFSLSKMYVSSPEYNSFPYLLKKSSNQDFFIKFNFARSTSRQVINYICSLQSFYEIGAAYDYKYAKARLIDYFDGIIFINEITESELFGIEN